MRVMLDTEGILGWATGRRELETSVVDVSAGMVTGVVNSI